MQSKVNQALEKLGYDRKTVGQTLLSADSLGTGKSAYCQKEGYMSLLSGPKPDVPLGGVARVPVRLLPGGKKSMLVALQEGDWSNQLCNGC